MINCVSRTIGANVQAKGHFQVLGRSPQGFVLWSIVGPPRNRADGDHSPHKANLGTAFQLLYTVLYNIYVEHCDTLEPLGDRTTKLSNPIVVDPAVGRQQFAVGTL